MEDLFKKFVNAGVGFLAQGNKKVQSTIDKLVKESKISEQEGKKILDELMKSSESKRKELEAQFQGLAERMMTSVGIVDAPKGKPRSGPSKPANAKGASAAKAGGATKAASKPAAKASAATKKAADGAAPKAPRASAARKSAPKADSGE